MSITLRKNFDNPTTIDGLKYILVDNGFNTICYYLEENAAMEGTYHYTVDKEAKDYIFKEKRCKRFHRSYAGTTYKRYYYCYNENGNIRLFKEYHEEYKQGQSINDLPCYAMGNNEISKLEYVAKLFFTIQN
ncbi:MULTISPECIES: hypothetical protein [unclassified Chryseobacterium]|uniref:hypothetical protein n=1 Tax=unclassified Chryseobacterium TaxID=2593645 RepID=UPI0030199DD0